MLHVGKATELEVFEVLTGMKDMLWKNVIKNYLEGKKRFFASCQRPVFLNLEGKKIPSVFLSLTHTRHSSDNYIYKIFF